MTEGETHFEFSEGYDPSSIEELHEEMMSDYADEETKRALEIYRAIKPKSDVYARDRFLAKRFDGKPKDELSEEDERFKRIYTEALQVLAERSLMEGVAGPNERNITVDRMVMTRETDEGKTVVTANLRKQWKPPTEEDRDLEEGEQDGDITTRREVFYAPYSQVAGGLNPRTPIFTGSAYRDDCLRDAIKFGREGLRLNPTSSLVNTYRGALRTAPLFAVEPSCEDPEKNIQRNLGRELYLSGQPEWAFKEMGRLFTGEPSELEIVDFWRLLKIGREFGSDVSRISRSGEEQQFHIPEETIPGFESASMLNLTNEAAIDRYPVTEEVEEAVEVLGREKNPILQGLASGGERLLEYHKEAATH